jgi:hypothetical protein
MKIKRISDEVQETVGVVVMAMTGKGDKAVALQNEARDIINGIYEDDGEFTEDEKDIDQAGIDTLFGYRLLFDGFVFCMFSPDRIPSKMTVEGLTSAQATASLLARFYGGKVVKTITAETTHVIVDRDAVKRFCIKADDDDVDDDDDDDEDDDEDQGEENRERREKHEEEKEKQKGLKLRKIVKEIIAEIREIVAKVRDDADETGGFVGKEVVDVEWIHHCCEVKQRTPTAHFNLLRK